MTVEQIEDPGEKVMNDRRIRFLFERPAQESGRFLQPLREQQQRSEIRKRFKMFGILLENCPIDFLRSSQIATLLQFNCPFEGDIWGDADLLSEEE